MWLTTLTLILFQYVAHKIDFDSVSVRGSQDWLCGGHVFLLSGELQQRSGEAECGKHDGFSGE